MTGFWSWKFVLPGRDKSNEKLGKTVAVMGPAKPNTLFNKLAAVPSWFRVSREASEKIVNISSFQRQNSEKIDSRRHEIILYLSFLLCSGFIKQQNWNLKKLPRQAFILVTISPHEKLQNMQRMRNEKRRQKPKYDLDTFDLSRSTTRRSTCVNWERFRVTRFIKDKPRVSQDAPSW